MTNLMTEVRKFHQLVDEIDGDPLSNPPEDPVGEASQFLEFLDITGKLKDYTPTDWQMAGQALGLTSEEINPWMEDAAAWIVNTTDSKGNVAPSAWGRKPTQKVKKNAPGATCGICVRDCPCECRDCQTCLNCVYCGCCCIC